MQRQKTEEQYADTDGMSKGSDMGKRAPREGTGHFRLLPRMVARV